jgi:ubiquinone/menaquinone biosynthesis C-methylase UbiE
MNEVKTSAQLQKNYDNYYEEGESEWRRLGAMSKAENIISLCSSLPHNSILEIGAGEGAILRRLSELGFCQELFALEISSSGVEAIKNKKIPQLVECQSFDGYHIPYGNDKFDVALLSHVVEHVEHPRQLLYEASRIAKFLFIEVPLEDNIRLPRDFTFDKVGHINFYSPKTIRQLIQSCNLRVLNQITTNPTKETYTFQHGKKGLIKYFIKQALLKTSPKLATGLFSYHSALVCEKTGL